jgi:hypothetical protein
MAPATSPLKRHVTHLLFHRTCQTHLRGLSIARARGLVCHGEDNSGARHDRSATRRLSCECQLHACPAKARASLEPSSSTATEALAAVAFTLGAHMPPLTPVLRRAVFAAAAPCSKLAQGAPTGLCFSTKQTPLAPQPNALNPATRRRQTGTTGSHFEARIPGTKTARQKLKPNSWASGFDALNWRPFSGPRNMTNWLAAWPGALLTGLRRRKVNVLPKILREHLNVH